MKFSIVVPNPKKMVSGGNLFNQQLIGFLERGQYTYSMLTEEEIEGTSIDGQVAIVDSLYITNASVMDALERFLGLKVLLYHLPSFIKDNASQQNFSKKEVNEEENILKKFDIVVVPSIGMKNWCIEQFGRIDPRNYYVLRPGKSFESKGQIVLKESSSIKILTVGAVCARKGQLRLVKALKNLDHIPWNLRIVGDLTRFPDEAEKIRTVISQYGLEERVRVEGLVSNEKLQEIYAESDMFILLSNFETFGIAIQEAMEFGLCIVVPNNKILKDEFGSETCHYVDIDNQTKLESQLILFLADVDAIRAMKISSAQEVQRRQSWDAEMTAFLQYLSRRAGDIL